jgi:4-hydroxybenzoate polyprenyltransferase
VPAKGRVKRFSKKSQNLDKFLTTSDPPIPNNELGAQMKTRVWNLRFWRAYWTTMRPYLIFVSGAAGSIGLAFTSEPDRFRLALAFLPLVLSYGLGQALTDCFQMDTDALSSPYRPLIRGIISRTQVLTVSLLGLAAGVLILAYLNPVILILGGLAVLGLLTYTILKKTWWGGPPWNSWIVALLPVIGRLTEREYRVARLVHAADSLAFWLSVAAVFFGYANFVVMGYFKDISADRQTGYRTFPVVFGWKATAFYSDAVSLAAAVCAGAALYLTRRLNILGIALFLLAAVINLSAQLRIHRTTEEKRAHGPIAGVVRAFVLYCAAIILTVRPGWVYLFIVYYSLFEFTLLRRPERSQV